ncbi:cellulose biosynthesis cyclic di-GMP-binding regulatory protein BcsB [Prosthecomicrobium pneumaticum]|uniref:Cyclic di-GMP-binding protein n=1 Tax=Prosthecomicrobium pneumaticum TaxID=81895 RepID=A0A7W9FL74_9HYPH|nr:hypothetical protein [Prosthecomicrobium pneumaticum]
MPEPAAGPQPAATEADERSLLPFGSVRFEGEMAGRSWTLFVTEEEAAAAASVTLAYRNAVLVMPERSRLRLVLNDQTVIDAPISAPETTGLLTADLPSGVLQPGANVFRLEAAQRHRTDCTIPSTYELWTEIDGSRSHLSFAGSAAELRPRSIDELAAVGFDGTGLTTIAIVAPGAQRSAAAAHIWPLAQSLALLGGFPNIRVEVLDAPPPGGGHGTLTVLLGTAEELAGLVGPEGRDAQSTTVTTFLDRPDLGRAVLLISGPRQGDIANAVEALVSRIDRPATALRETLDTASWESPPVRLFRGEQTVPLSALGVRTTEFSGRRFSTTFAVAVTADFYAAAYGEAALLLDAAFTEAVRPASHLDVYVNGHIAATTRIIGRRGGIFRHYPVPIPLRHFTPGINHVTIEANLDTAADEACAPDAAATDDSRFVLFDTTEFHMPAFARAARTPDLAALSGTGYPYGPSVEPVSLVLGRHSPQVISAAATLLGRLALQAGRIVPVAETSASAAPRSMALFVGAAAQTPPVALQATRIAESARTDWREPAGQVPTRATEQATERAAPPADTEQVFDRWRDRLSGGGGWQGQVSSFEDWLQRTFDISLSELRLRAPEAPPYAPARETSLVIAQAAAPTGDGVWTVFAAPSEDLLADAMAAATREDRWRDIDGRLATYAAATDTIETAPAAAVTFLPLTDRSVGNLRMIAANWLSSNILVYAVALVLMCAILGAMTAFLLRRIGRQG